MCKACVCCRKTYGRAVGMKAKDKVAEATLHALRCTDAGTERKGDIALYMPARELC